MIVTLPVGIPIWPNSALAAEFSVTQWPDGTTTFDLAEDDLFAAVPNLMTLRACYMHASYLARRNKEAPQSDRAEEARYNDYMRGLMALHNSPAFTAAAMTAETETAPYASSILRPDGGAAPKGWLPAHWHKYIGIVDEIERLYRPYVPTYLAALQSAQNAYDLGRQRAIDQYGYCPDQDELDLLNAYNQHVVDIIAPITASIVQDYKAEEDTPAA